MMTADYAEIEMPFALIATLAQGSSPASPAKQGSPASDALPLFMIVLGLLALGLVLLSSVRSRIAARKAEYQEPRERILELKRAAAARETVESARGEMLDLAQTLISQIDAKAARLEMLLAETEREQAKLQQLLEEARSGGISAAREAPLGKAKETGACTALAQPRQATTSQLHEPKSATPPTPGAETPGQTGDPLFDHVYTLADAGRSSAEIAREIDEHIGKVELILALRQHRAGREREQSADAHASAESHGRP